MTEEGCPRQNPHLDNTDGFSCALGLDPVNFLNVVLSHDKNELVQYRFGDLVSWTNSVTSTTCIHNVLTIVCVQVIHAGPEHVHTEICDFDMYMVHGPPVPGVPYRTPWPVRAFWYMDFDRKKVVREEKHPVTHGVLVVPPDYNAVVQVTSSPLLHPPSPPPCQLGF